MKATKVTKGRRFKVAEGGSRLSLFELFVSL